MKLQHPRLIAALLVVAVTSVVGSVTFQFQQQRIQARVLEAHNLCESRISSIRPDWTVLDREIFKTSDMANCISDRRNTPLNKMIELLGEYSPGIIKEFLEYKPSLYEYGYDNKNALMRSAERNYAAVVMLLIQTGVEIDAANKYGRTALFFAACHPETASLLLVAGADPNRVDISDSTPLHDAASCASTEALLLLIRNGAKISARDVYDRTPLAIAVVQGHYEFSDSRDAMRSIILLLNSGADPKTELTPEAYAILMKMAEDDRELWYALSQRLRRP